MDDDEPLVRVMPRTPLYPLRGLITRIDLTVLTAIDEEGWFATRKAIAGDVDGKEVRLAVVVTRGTEALVDAEGRLAFEAAIGPECEGLVALKLLAKATAEQVSCAKVKGIELVGYLNDDIDPALRHVFVLAYRARVPVDTVVPAGYSWLGKAQLPRPVDMVSVKFADLLV